MSGLAQILSENGYWITGTDPALRPEVGSGLEKLGIVVSQAQDGSRIPQDCQLLVHTAAITEDHPEILAAGARDIPRMKYAEMLSLLMKDKRSVAVAGTHGKTTTASIAVAALEAAGAKPGFLIGSKLAQFDSGARAAKSDVFVAEACEYDRSFLHLHPPWAVLPNVEPDHLDHYRDLDEIHLAFEQFVRGLEPGGGLVYNADCPQATLVASAAKGETISFSTMRDSHFRAVRLRSTPTGTLFDLEIDGRSVLPVSLPLSGRHNVSNCLGVLAVCHQMGYSLADLARGISGFKGVSRRFEVLGEPAGVTVIDDYAHHPTEIRAMLHSARERYPTRRIVVAFQPHQISRTRILFDDFVSAFDQADIVFLAPIFAARDETGEESRTASDDLAEGISKRGTRATSVAFLQDLEPAVMKLIEKGDVLISAGAGNINSVSRSFLKHLSNS